MFRSIYAKFPFLSITRSQIVTPALACPTVLENVYVICDVQRAFETTLMVFQFVKTLVFRVLVLLTEAT